MGPRTTELISLGVMAMQNELDIHKIKTIVLPHLTFLKSFLEAVMATSGGTIHLVLAKINNELQY